MNQCSEPTLASTVKHALRGHSKIDKTNVLMENGSLMKDESNAECSPWSILQHFLPALSDNRYWKPVLVFFSSGRLRQVLLYCPFNSKNDVFIIIHSEMLLFSDTPRWSVVLQVRPQSLPAGASLQWLPSSCFYGNTNTYQKIYVLVRKCYNKTCLKRPLENRQNKDLNDKL